MRRRGVAQGLGPRAERLHRGVEFVRIRGLDLLLGRGDLLPPTASLTQRVEQVDGGAADLPGTRIALVPVPDPDPAVGLDVVDPFARPPTDLGEPTLGQWSRLDGLVVAEPAGLVVPGLHVPGLRLVGPVRVAGHATGVEGQAHHPVAVVVPPGIPAEVVVVVVLLGQSLGDEVAEREGGRSVGAGTAQPNPAGLGGDELPFGEYRALVAAHVRDRHAGGFGDLLGGLPGADAGLDLPGAQTAVGLQLDLAEPRTVTPHRGAQCIVQPDTEPLTPGAPEHEVLAVVMDADEREVIHGCSLRWQSDPTVPPLTPDPKHVTGRGARCRNQGVRSGIHVHAA